MIYCGMLGCTSERASLRLEYDIQPCLSSDCPLCTCLPSQEDNNNTCSPYITQQRTPGGGAEGERIYLCHDERLPRQPWTAKQLTPLSIMQQQQQPRPRAGIERNQWPVHACLGYSRSGCRGLCMPSPYIPTARPNLNQQQQQRKVRLHTHPGAAREY